jgi:hypothetical protein
VTIRLGDVEALPLTLSSRQAADALGVSYDHFLDNVRAGRIPIEPLRLGQHLRWPTAGVLRVLGIAIGEREA